MRPTSRQGRTLLRVLPAGVAVAALALTSCSSGGSSGTSSTAASGGTLKVDLSATPTCLDPGVAYNANERAVVRTLADSLVDMRPQIGEIVPWLASSWEQNSNATQFTFHLRDGETFSDGTPVDAEAVKASLDYVKNKLKSTSSRGAGYLSTYTGTKVIDAHTAEVDFAAPAVQFLAGASTTTLAILSVSSASKTPDQRCAGDYVGSGPFTLKNYTQGQSAQVVNRKDYAWPSALAKHKGAAYLDGIDFQVVDTSNARDGALESRQAGVALDIATQDMPALKGAGVSPLQGTQSGMPASFIVNTTRPGLSDAAVRQAIMIGFDRASDVKAVLGSFYSPATSVLTKNLPQYKDESAATTFDAAKAKSTLDGSGWQAGPDGIRSKDGVKLDFTVTYTSTYGPYYTSLLQLFQQQMKDIGIGITLKNLTQAGVLGVAPKHDFDFYMSSLTDADPDIIRSSAVNFLFADQNALKSTGIAQLFTQSQSDADPTARKATYAKIQDSLISNGFIIPFWEGAQLVGAGKQVSGLALDFQSWLLFYDVSLNG